MKNSKFSKTKKAGMAYALLSIFLLAALCIAFEILIIQMTRLPIVARNSFLFTVLSIGITILLLVVSILAILRRKEKLYKTLLSSFVVLLFFLVIFIIVIKTDFITVLQSPELYQEFLKKTGAWMPVLYILLQFLQVVLLPIPSVVSTLAGVALFGALKTTIYSLIGIIAGSFTGFFMGRKLGYKAVGWLIGREELSEWLKKVKGKDNLILTMMFILPLFPDDLLCFIAGLSTMSLRYFSVMMVSSRILSVTATCFSFEFIPFNTWWGLLIWAFIFIIVIAVFVLLYKNLNRFNEWLAKKKSKKQ